MKRSSTQLTDSRPEFRNMARPSRKLLQPSSSHWWLLPLASVAAVCSTANAQKPAVSNLISVNQKVN